MIFWLVLKFEISYNRVIIISWRIFGFLERIFWRLYFCMVKYLSSAVWIQTSQNFSSWGIRIAKHILCCAFAKVTQRFSISNKFWQISLKNSLLFSWTFCKIILWQTSVKDAWYSLSKRNLAMIKGNNPRGAAYHICNYYEKYITQCSIWTVWFPKPSPMMEIVLKSPICIGPSSSYSTRLRIKSDCFIFSAIRL
jgi:hypothetical protein